MLTFRALALRRSECWFPFFYQYRIPRKAYQLRPCNNTRNKFILFVFEQKERNYFALSSCLCFFFINYPNKWKARRDLFLSLFIQICFELVDIVLIEKVVNNKATYYTRIDSLPEFTKPDPAVEAVPGITIWMDESHALRKYEFQCAKADKYSPIGGFEMTDVR